MTEKTAGNIILMTLICLVIFWVFMALRPVQAQSDPESCWLQQSGSSYRPNYDPRASEWEPPDPPDRAPDFYYNPEAGEDRGVPAPLPRPRPDAPVLTYPGENFDAWLEKTRPPVPYLETRRHFSAEALPGMTLTPSWMMTTRGSRAAGAPLPTPGSLPHVEMLPIPSDQQIARAALDRIPIYSRNGRYMAPYSTMLLPGFEREAFYNFLRNQRPSTNIEDRRGEIQPTLQPGERSAA
jgi:hypothetical protein